MTYHSAINACMIPVAPHPLLDLRLFETVFPRPIGGIAVPESVRNLLGLQQHQNLPFPPADDLVREKIRRLLRHGGFRPTGRSKPASEYLLKAVNENLLSSINLAVDLCNVVSLHSGLPISVIDLDRAVGPLRVDLAKEGESYVFNASGQTIDVAGLLCLFDADGPCANAVKDAQRTKTTPQTLRTLSIIWGTNELPQRSEEVLRWYVKLLTQAEARVTLQE